MTRIKITQEVVSVTVKTIDLVDFEEFLILPRNTKF